LTQVQAEEIRFFQDVEDMTALQENPVTPTDRKLDIIFQDLLLQPQNNADGDTQSQLRSKEDSAFRSGWYHLQKQVASYFLEDFEAAVHHGDVYRQVQKDAHMLVTYLLFLCVDALARVALYRSQQSKKRSRRTRRRLLLQARRNLGIIQKMSRVVPDYCLGKRFVVQAELSSLRAAKQRWVALEQYKCAIGQSQMAGILFEQAVAFELAGQFLLESDNSKGDGIAYLKEACVLYERWGVCAKVTHLQHRISTIQEGNGSPSRHRIMSAPTMVVRDQESRDSQP